MNRSRPFDYIFLMSLLILAYVFAKFQGGFVSWFLFYAFLPIALYSLLYHFFVFRLITVERRVNKRTCTAGDSLEITYTVQNPYRFPVVYLLIEDPKPFSSDDGSHPIIFYPWFKQKLSTTIEVPHLPRGVFHWREMRITSGDPFGLIQTDKRYVQEQEIVVYPRYEELKHWPVRQANHTGQTDLAYHPAKDFTAIIGARDYVPGDRLGHIHWKASASSGRLKTMEFESSSVTEFMFFLDRDQHAYGQVDHPLFEKAVSLTAALIHYRLKRRDASGLISYGQARTWIKPASGQEQLYRIFAHLARIKADFSFSFIHKARREAAALLSGTAAIVISPRLDHEMVDFLKYLRDRRLIVQFFWVQGTGELNVRQQSHLTLLHKEKLAYHILQEDGLNRGQAGGSKHVSA